MYPDPHLSQPSYPDCPKTEAALTFIRVFSDTTWFVPHEKAAEIERAGEEERKLHQQALLNAKVLIKSLLVAKAALENARKFVQRNGSEDDANLHHDALYHVEHCLNELQQKAARETEREGL